ncbi:MAG TPA: tRNA (guanosine(37)-N1)-methyltransferase TrmD [Candidatus Saccharimonadales bacterium]|nr:tRNA (guanosine(37)-N1)-methyltransferase TrmD [Candidatus Saccharimonadales bacterium]
MLKFNVITLFPQLFTEHLNNLPFKRAIEKEKISVGLCNLRDFALDSYGTVDDKPYGGGTGMILMVEPIYNALKSLEIDPETTLAPTKRIVLLSPKGKKFTEQMAKELMQSQEVTFICGRYEGVDARVEDYVTDIVSIGDYVLSGGELPALVIMESITRLIPGVLEKDSALTNESHNENQLEYPQYTRPDDFKGKKVPQVLLSGNHKEIEKYKKENTKTAND